MADKPPFDPVWGAWILLLVIAAGVAVNSILIFVGCVLLGEATACARTGSQLRDITLELLTSLAILVSVRR